MIEVLAFATTVVCAIGGLVVLGAGILRRYRWRAVLPLLVTIEIALVAQAIFDVVGQVRGHELAETATHAAYLGASLVVLPAVGTQSARDDGRWSAVLVAVALVALAVIVVRMQTTWRVTGG
ncbi:hypothetical protein [Labedaea rhizosphaerae]|uniref:Uncharacterized protein n=1 Tax=Labedaea rhizosphaerae TaxID=598644 RepID=A0A4R6S3Y8_LABRH|nr:hypothetical protein [Labedaea rhizosphaerae]TDP94003.1 hypothetical protein EV186_106397 [Labedaea rhizosphaerae]